TPTTHIYTLSLHDALPIFETDWDYDAAGNVIAIRTPAGDITNYTYDDLGRLTSDSIVDGANTLTRLYAYDFAGNLTDYQDRDGRSEEHTSELQSRSDLVCR